MKRLIIVLLIIGSVSMYAQESVLLRFNYAQGDNYLVVLESKQNMGKQGAMNISLAMEMIVTEVAEEYIKTESKVTSFVINMVQGGETMSYDSNKKKEALDEVGKMLKSRFDPMLKATVHASFDNMGHSVETKMKSAILEVTQLTNGMSSINYPENKISVGSSWTSENENEGMKMSTIYTVNAISDGIVVLDVLGHIDGGGTGAIKGETVVDINSGVPKSVDLEVNMTVQGKKISIITNTTMKKI